MKAKKWIDKGSYSKLILLNKKDLKSNLLLQIVKVKPKSKINPHYHKKTKEVFFILKGKATLLLKNKKIKAKPGDFFVCKPGNMHGVINHSKKEFLILVLKINPKERDSYWVH